jgi:hypothetical protein
MYVSNVAFLRGAPVLIPCHSSDCDPTDKNPQLTAICPSPCQAPSPPNQVKGLINTSTFDPSAPGAFGMTRVNPMPDVPNVVQNIRTAVGDQMTGTYNGSTVYNLKKIFETLGSTGEGNGERNLAKPSGCTYGSATTDQKCQVWQDLLYVGGRRATGADPGPADAPSYYFMGIPRWHPMPLRARHLRPSTPTWSTRVRSSSKWASRRPCRVWGRGSMRWGQDSSTFLVTSDRSVNRLVDVTMGTNANGQAVLRDKAPIFFIDDGYFRIEGGTNYAYNGIATVITGQELAYVARWVHPPGR